MDGFTRKDLDDLLVKQKGICVSIFIPAFEKGAETGQNQIRFKNALNVAEKALKEMGNKELSIKEYLIPARKLLKDSVFWQNQAGGLAAFMAEHYFRTFRLPIQFKELTVVADRFHLKPLLSLSMGDSTFYLLALSQNSARLFKGNRLYIEEIVIPNMPHGISEALLYEESEKQLQFHSGASGSSRIRPAIFHGHGIGNDDKKDKILRYCREVHKAVQDNLRKKKSPLILACVEYLLPLYREVNTYEHLMDQYLNGNPDHMNAYDLHGPAWSIMEKYLRKDIEKALKEFEKLKQTAQASEDLKMIVQSAAQGKVKTLLIPKGIQTWGIFNKTDNSVEIHSQRMPGDRDLLDLAAIESITKGGSAHMLNPREMPGNAQAAAIFRY